MSHYKKKPISQLITAGSHSPCLRWFLILLSIEKLDKKKGKARELRIFLDDLGLPKIRFHDLRATWAIIMLSIGIAPIKVMIMGV